MEELKAIRVQGMSRTLVITQAAIIAALYTVLTILASLLRSTHHPPFL